MPPTNPFSDYSDDQVNAITSTAYTPVLGMGKGAESWFDINDPIYNGDWDQMYDTVATKWLDAAGRKIVNADARKAFGRSLVAQKGLAPARGLVGGTVPTGTNVSSIGGGGNIFRSGNVYSGLDTSSLGKMMANVAAGSPALKQYANDSQTFDSVRKAMAGIYGGPTASLLDAAIGKAGSDARGADPHAYGDNPFWGGLGGDPFSSSTAGVLPAAINPYTPPTAAVTPPPGQPVLQPPSNTTPTVMPPNNGLPLPLPPPGSRPGVLGVDDVGYDPNDEMEYGTGDGYGSYASWKAQHPGGTRANWEAWKTAGKTSGVPVTNGMAQTPTAGNTQFRRQKFQETNGYDWEPWQEKYWNDQAARFGDEYANEKIANNSLTRARAMARQMGRPDVPPRIHNAQDINGMLAFYEFLKLDPQNQRELPPWATWVESMQRTVAASS